jgi:NAD(P)H-hydrate epimerase
LSEEKATKIEVIKNGTLITSQLVQSLIPPRNISSRKGDNGIVLVVGGSGLYHGAPILSSSAALRSGVDLVYTAIPKSNVLATRSYSPDIIALPLPKDNLTVGSARRLLKILPKIPDAAAIGMGMALEAPKALVYLINELKNMGVKLLLDASALIPEILPHISKTNTIVTPHPGEYKRMFQPGDINTNININTDTIPNEQISPIYNFAKIHGITIILKGYNNIICDGLQERIAIIKRSTPAMTVGGSGDVLSGLVTGFLAKKIQPFDASILGIYFNGIAADLAYQRVGLHMTATDLIDDLSNAIKPYDKIKR